MRMVSRLTGGPSFRFAASSAISRTLHRALPSGGGPQTMATIRCFCPAFSTRAWPGRGFSCKAESSPSSSYRRAIARTVFAATPAFAATCATFCPSSSWRKMEARRNTRADS
jgi:hypothetical protein